MLLLIVVLNKTMLIYIQLKVDQEQVILSAQFLSDRQPRNRVFDPAEIRVFFSSESPDRL
jgi:hypothetical protein